MSTATNIVPMQTDATIPAFEKRPPREELLAVGKALREKCPRKSHAAWKPPKNRPDPVALVEEARASVLEAYAGKSVFSYHGQRVVNSHRLIQSASDIFLGWTVGEQGWHFYIRQLRDIKIKPVIENFSRSFMVQYADWCGHTLARAHARSGEPAIISGYLSNNDAFDQAIAKFTAAYADQNERDHHALAVAARKGRVKVLIEQL